jgi:hypothetical protein
MIPLTGQLTSVHDRLGERSSEPVPLFTETRMKRLRRDRNSWYQPPPPPAAAVFRCRQCHVDLTRPLCLLSDVSALSKTEGQSLLPEGHFWLVGEGHDFAGQFAVPLADVIGVRYHTDRNRLIGCCGPSGSEGPNRVCGCGCEIGTERSDCIWPHAVYLDPVRVLAVSPDAKPAP